MNVKIIIICLSLMVLNVPGIAFSAEQLNTFTFQGRLANADGSPISSTLNMTFRIYDHQSNEIWSETRTVHVVSGEYHLIIGKSNPIGFTVNEQAATFGISVESEPEMQPGQDIGGVLRAGIALSVTNAAITTLKLADNAVTADKLSDGAVTSAKIYNNSVTSDKLSNDALTSEKLSNGIVTAEKFSASGGSSLTSGTVGESLLSNGDGTFNWGTANGDTDITITTTSTNITLSSEQSGVVLVTGNTTITLPSPSSLQGKEFTIKKTDISGYTVTISGVVDGETNPQLSEQYSYMTIISNGSAWLKTAENATTPSTSTAKTYITNSLGMTFRLIPAGTFLMGSPSDELGRGSDETQYTVTISEPYYMQTTEVTQGQWEAVMGNNPSGFGSCGLNCPLENVSWNDCQTFIATLNAMGEGSYTLPTEAQWEYAARAGSNKAFANGIITNTLTADPNLNLMGWYSGNSNSETHGIAQKLANAWGLYDVHGNVWEWCKDWYDTYPTTSVTDPQGAVSGSYHVARGGSWYNKAQWVRLAERDTLNSGTYGSVGLRLLKLP
jgi:formylglycine-generating enzyme required for sulfatase activity